MVGLDAACGGLSGEYFHGRHAERSGGAKEMRAAARCSVNVRRSLLGGCANPSAPNPSAGAHALARAFSGRGA